MSTTGLNVCVGIDAGSNTSKIAYSDSAGTKLIAELDGFDINALREEAEVYFDEPVFSCIIAIPDNFNRRQRDEIVIKAKNSGFKNVEIISSHEAEKIGLENRVLVYDFGASKSEMIIFDDGEISENVVINDVSGNEFDRIFSEWLSERFTLNLIDRKIINEQAKRIKITLSEHESVQWRNAEISRDDFERLIYFSVKRAAHTAKRLIRIYSPDRIILTGGCVNIPVVRKIFAEVFKTGFEISLGLAAKGASLMGRSSDKNSGIADIAENSAKLRELRGNIIELEEKLTRNQKDRLYLLFRNAEAINSPEIINLMENLINEIRNA